MTTHVLLTGGTRGIGAAIARRLAREDVRLVATGSADGDLADPATPARLWASAQARLDGRIDVLVNNAGVFEAAPIDLPDAEWSARWARTLQVNLVASAELCRLAVAHFLARGAGGRIVNVASRAAHRGDGPDHWHYAASKGGMLAMTRTIARGYARQGVLAFAVCPGFTVTGPAEDYLASRGGERLLADIPLGRVAEPEEVAEVAVFAALSAPPSMTGATLDVNGASYVR
ncbi:SDR family NAD(P)-dependent oxidoreductase [Coralloluteibacterium thermophilus]|uniref:SDR family NAD(P)-dependent oxidoreductase n=1 Tax=Coralloluteibacterium thermophilum TaxID=2707049 RepID=A0ABV9NMY0_9GAMM